MLKNPDQKSFFMLLYSECNQHAREQPKFRDQVILFYTAVCAFYLSQLSQLSDTMFFLLTFAMFILGLLCSLIVINFRSWIIQYGKAAEVVGRLLISQQEFASLDEIIAFIAADCKTVSIHKRAFLLRMGNIIVIGFCFITLAPFAAVYDHFSNIGFGWHIAIIASAFIYWGLLIFLCWKQLNKAEQMNDKTWIIRFSDMTQIFIQDSKQAPPKP